MSGAARRYHDRSPRYVFNADDESLLRYAPLQTKGVIARATVRNLSETGMAFSFNSTTSNADGFGLPEEGDVLKVEFTVPGHKQIACFATVVRVDHAVEWDPELGDRMETQVAVHFRNLPTLHRRALQLGLQDRVASESSVEWTSLRREHKYAFAGLTLALFILFFVMALPHADWIDSVRSVL